MKQGRIKCEVWSLIFADLPGFFDVQEAIPAASSTAKPPAEESVSQGTASEELAQECLREENQTENIERKAQRGSEKGKRHIWWLDRDRWHDRHESIMYWYLWVS